MSTDGCRSARARARQGLAGKVRVRPLHWYGGARRTCSPTRCALSALSGQCPGSARPFEPCTNRTNKPSHHTHRQQAETHGKRGQQRTVSPTMPTITGRSAVQCRLSAERRQARESITTHHNALKLISARRPLIGKEQIMHILVVLYLPDTSIR